MIKIGIIGTTIGKEVAKAFQYFENTRILAICGKNEEKTKSTAEELEIQNYYTDWKKLIDNEEVDLVGIHSPNFLHKEMFDYAVQNNKHILLDKPAGIDANEILSMINITKNYQKEVFINHAARFNPILQYIKNKISSGYYGEINTIRVSGYLGFYSNPETQYNWMLDKSQGGGQIGMMGVHMIDLARYLIGMKKFISGQVLKSSIKDILRPKANVETSFVAQYKSEDNVLVQLFNNAYCAGYKNFELQVFGNKGIIFYDDINGLRESMKFGKEFQQIEVKDHLSHVKLGRSILSKSIKFLVKDYVDLLSGNQIEKSKFCTLQHAYDNMKYLQEEFDV